MFQVCLLILFLCLLLPTRYISTNCIVQHHSPSSSWGGSKTGILLVASSAWLQVFQLLLLKHLSFLLLPGAFTRRRPTHCRASIWFNNPYTFALAPTFLSKFSKTKKLFSLAMDRLIPAWPILPLELSSFTH